MTIYIVVFLVCCLGHAMIWVRAINWMHGIRSQKAWTDVIRFGMHLILSGSPAAWLLLTAFQAPEWDSSTTGPGFWFILGYASLTFVLGLYFPVLWYLYAHRQEPSLQRRVERQQFDIGRELGYRPVGQGRRGWMAHLPMNQAYEFELVERELVLSRLPAAWDGLRILHVSDIHFWGRPDRGYFERVLQLCASQPCDLLVLTGDIVDSDKHYDWLPLLSVIQPKEAILAIRGNHDARYDGDKVSIILEQQSFQLLGGTTRLMTLRGEPLLVAGNEAPWFLPIPDLKAHEHRDCFRLALIHSPDQFHWAVQKQFDLVLAGHNHGGQIRIPGFGSIFVPSKTGRRYDMGLFQEGNTVLHVSKGLSGGHPVRYFCRPEATWLTLRLPSSHRST